MVRIEDIKKVYSNEEDVCLSSAASTASSASSSSGSRPAISSGRQIKSKKRYPCTFEGCGKVYTRLYSVKIHMNTHYNIRKYECDVCHKKFTLKQYLREHVLTHTGEKPFACPFPGCEARFRQNGKLSIHKKTHLMNKSTVGQVDNKVSPATKIQSVKVNESATATSKKDEKVTEPKNPLFEVKASTTEDMLHAYVKSTDSQRLFEMNLMPIPGNMLWNLNLSCLVFDNRTKKAFINPGLLEL
mmetsp:Transcript_54415/g.62347  ORF Transcript_54415/g.62347 Transcript_54415/m.62347 type:complete len:243 (-) Transcript_54415:793-1521(-)